MMFEVALKVALIDTVSTLAITWLKERRDTNAKVDADAFKDWLQNVAFDQIMSNADQTLRSVVSLKASNHEHFEQILRLLNEVHETLHGRGAKAQWRSLTDCDRTALITMYETALNSEHGAQALNPRKMCSDYDADDVMRSCKAIAEMGFAKELESSRSYDIRMENSGILFVWEATDDPPYNEGVGTIESFLISNPSGKTTKLQEIVEATDLPLGLVAAYAAQLAANGDIGMSETGWASQARVSAISESMRRRVETRDKNNA